MSNYTIEEFKVWRGIDPEKPTWNTVNIYPGTREGAEEIMSVLQANSPEKTFRIVTHVSQVMLDRRRRELAQARERVKASQGYVDYIAFDIAEMKREAYRQGVELK